MAEQIAQASGATADVHINQGYPVTVNNPELTARMLPTLERVAGGQLREIPKNTVSEDFSFFANAVPGMFVLLGITPTGQVGKAAANHSPQFYVDEKGLVTGVRTLANLAADYLFSAQPGR
jgi:metal-dependent amidase/aminoacylase/carboxypeptidase family protein